MPASPRWAAPRFGSVALRDDRPPGAAILANWSRLRRFPGGERIFSRVIGWQTPYSGSIGAIVRELEPGRAVVSLRDRRSVRNHLDSIHAVALTNLGELASGLALVTDLPAGTRAIVTDLQIEFLKKARGRLVAVGSASAPPRDDLDHGPVACVARAEIRDMEGEVVAILRADWQVGLREPAPANPLPEKGEPD